MSAEIKEKVSRLSDEEILKMLASPFPDYRREWIDFSEEELRKRGFVLEHTDTQLNVITPDGLKLMYRKAQSNAGSNVLPITENPESRDSVWTPFTILLVVLSALVSIVPTGVFSLVIAQIPENTLEWVGPETIAIFIISVFIGSWTIIFSLLAKRFNAK